MSGFWEVAGDLDGLVVFEKSKSMIYEWELGEFIACFLGGEGTTIGLGDY